MKSRLKLAFLGDDFTGSTDALEMLAMSGLRCVLFLKPPTPASLATFHDLDAVGLAGDSRAMTPAEMKQRLPAMYGSLVALNPAIVHYKVCSTFDSANEIGSIGTAMSVARQSGMFAEGPVPVLGGNPALKRYCTFGQLFAASATDGKTHRIDRHPIMSVHPVTPMHEADLARHINAQSPMTFSHCFLPDLELTDVEVDARVEQLWATGSDAVLFDGANQEHMRTAGSQLIKRSTMQTKPTFVVGSSGVENALTRAWRATAPAGAMPPAAAVDKVLAISGSGSDMTAIQIDQAVAQGFLVLPVSARKLVDDAQFAHEISAISHAAVGALKDGRSVLLETAKGAFDPRIEDMLAYLQRDGRNRAAVRHEGGRLLGVRLGLLTRAILEQVSLRRFLIAGGDTSSQIMQVLEADALMMVAKLAPGVPLCRIISSSSRFDGIEVALKGGQLGGRNFFTDGLKGVSDSH